MRLIFEVLAEKQLRKDEERLWQVYMGNVVSMWSKDTKTFTEVLEQYNRDRKRPPMADIDEAFSNAEKAFAILEQARGGA